MFFIHIWNLQSKTDKMSLHDIIICDSSIAPSILCITRTKHKWYISQLRYIALPWFTCIVLISTFKGLLLFEFLSELSNRETKKQMPCNQLQWIKSQMEHYHYNDRISQPTSRCPWKHRYWPSQQCRSQNKLPCGAQMSKELSSLAPLSVNRPPACTYLQVCI